MDINRPVLYSEGDDRFKVGELVEFILGKVFLTGAIVISYIIAVQDARSGVIRLRPSSGIITEIHTEPVDPPIYMDRESPQYYFARQAPPVMALQTQHENYEQVRVVGFDIRLTCRSCWAPDELPEYYVPKSR
jgi:hypothetical protein